ncbi:hypothetical protein BGZ97_002104 [Linnemannia gamsii]|uniref:Uncharacterized protein n=1 Tax=Linnemannia gamsii TaxID=64522 RepID=A0A9P6USY4_9FUNG|nr:hypothetical protein BGZ97_002104 [Linnemannia gamsii]
MYKPSTLYRAVTMMVLASFVLTYVQAYSWTANGGCATSWAGRCHSQCKGEALNKSQCKGKTVDSGIESSNCIWGWNICRCKCFVKTRISVEMVDSMRGLMLVSRAEETFSITQWTDDASKSTTPSDDAHYIAKKLNIK